MPKNRYQQAADTRRELAQQLTRTAQAEAEVARLRAQLEAAQRAPNMAAGQLADLRADNERLRQMVDQQDDQAEPVRPPRRTREPAEQNPTGKLLITVRNYPGFRKEFKFERIPDPTRPLNPKEKEEELEKLASVPGRVTRGVKTETRVPVRLEYGVNPERGWFRGVDFSEEKRNSRSDEMKVLYRCHEDSDMKTLGCLEDLGCDWVETVDQYLGKTGATEEEIRKATEYDALEIRADVQAETGLDDGAELDRLTRQRMAYEPLHQGQLGWGVSKRQRTDQEMEEEDSEEVPVELQEIPEDAPTQYEPDSDPDSDYDPRYD